MTIRLLCDRPPYPTGALLTLTAAEETSLVAQKLADTNLTGGFVYTPPKQIKVDDPVNQLNPQQVAGVQSLVSKDGTSGVWRQLPASGVIMRVRITGAGTVSMDSATGDLGTGTVTSAAYTATVAGTQIDDYAYPGDAARSIRFTLTGTAAVEVY